MNRFRLKTCIECQGDLVADDGDWLCLQCGTYYYTGLYQLHPQIDDGPEDSGAHVSEQSEKQLEGVLTDPQSSDSGRLTTMLVEAATL